MKASCSANVWRSESLDEGDGVITGLEHGAVIPLNELFMALRRKPPQTELPMFFV
jgi:hypothetical protein